MKLKHFIFALVAMLSGFAFTANAQVAKVGNTEYATIDEAITNWTNGTTLTLLADVTLSDVIQLSSTEHHILDLGTYTMTAASKKDAIQIVNNGRSSASYALDIKADAENPGGITASGKAVVKTTGKSGVKDRPIIRFYGGVFTGTNVVYHSGSNGTNCPQFWFYGGVFNGTVYANRALFQFYGGTFNGAIQISVDSSAYALVSGGRFKKLSNQYGSSLNSDKFTIGSAKGNYNRGIYVDAEGYYVITSAPITEVSAKYPAVKKESYNSNNYFYYSAAAANGMFYEVASMAGTGSNVTVWDGAKVVEELKGNEALEYTPELPAEVQEFEVELTDVVLDENTSAPAKVVFTVTPSNANGEKVSNPASPITFRIPVPAAWAGKQVYVSHDGARMDGKYTVQSGNYVEVTSASFSEFAVEPVPPVAKIGNVEYSTLIAAIAAVQDGQTITLTDNVVLAERVTIPANKTLTIDLNGKSISMEESIIATAYAINNLGNLTITDGVGGGSINARGMYNGYGDGGDNVASATITILGGTFNAKGTNGGGAAIFNYGVADIQGGTFTSVASYAIALQTGSTMTIGENAIITGGINSWQSTLTITGGTISNDKSGKHVVYAGESAVTINGGTFHNNNSGNATIMASGSTAAVEITGGTFTLNIVDASSSYLIDATSSATYTISGGSFTGGIRAQGGTKYEIAGGTFTNEYGNYNVYEGGDINISGGTFTGSYAQTFAKNNLAAGYELGTGGAVAKKSIAAIGENKYETLQAAAAAAQAGDEIVMLADETLAEALTLPAGITFNGNGKQITGTLVAAGDITFAGVTKAGDLDFAVGNTVVNIPAGASLQLNGSARMSIGFGTTFNIVGTIADAKTADKATVVPSLVIPGASFSGAGVKFNVTNAYISVPSSYCSTSKTASGTFDFNITNSIWESAGKLAFEEQSVNAKVDFALVNSVLTTGSHLVFGTASGEEGVVIDNSYVNKDTSRQLENCGTMTVKNGSVVNGAVATSSNAKNPGTVIVENATYAVTGEFSGSDLGTGTIIIKKDANVSVGSVKAGANVTVDAEGMTAGDVVNFTADLSQFTGTLSVINNDKLEASIVGGKIVLAAKPVAKIGETPYTTLEAAFAAATEGQTITMLDDATPALTSQRAITKAAVIDLGDKTLTLTEDDLYFGTTTFKNGTIIVDPSVKPSTAVFWMFANQTLTFDNVKIVATGVTGTYLIGLEGDNSDLNLLNGSEILVENTAALDLDIICVNGTNTCDIKVENSKVNVTNLDGRVFFRGNYTVKDSEVNLAGITKAGFRIEAGQTLSIEGTSKVNIEGEPRDGGIHMTDLSATYTKAETATVNATVNEPKVAKVGENTYRTLAQAVAAVEDGGTITLIANETFTKNNRYNNGGWWDGLGYSGDKSFTIDLAGFTISQDGALNDYLMWFKNDGAKDNTITLKNGTLDAGTTAYCALATASSNAKKITVNLENIELINNNSNGATLKIRGGAVLNANAGTIITGKNSYVGIEAVGSKTVVNIYEGAKIYQNGKSSSWGCLAGASGNSTINVYGGEGTSAKGGFIAMTSGGTINIFGGEWTANTDGTIANDNNGVLIAQSDKQYNAGAGNSIVNVIGGTFKGGYNCYGNAVGDAQINIKGGNFNSNPTNYVAEDYIAVENNGVWNVVKAAAKIDGVAYASLEAAFKAATEGCEIVILDNVTVDYNWDARNTGSKFTVPVTINGNGKTIKFTASVNDNNYQAPFRFEADATVKDLTIDMSEVTDSRFRAISSKGNLIVDGCTFIGKDATLNCRAVIFGEGAGANVGNLAISVTNSEFINWKRGISDNENGQDVKTATITGNTLENAAVYVSAYENVTFTGNTVEGAYVDIRSYTANSSLNVTATGNILEENTDTAYNYIKATGNIDQEGFKVYAVAKIGDVEYTTIEKAYAALQEGDEIVILKKGSYALKVKNNVTITGAVAGVEFANIGAFGCNGANVTFNNVTFTYAENSTYKGLQHSGNLVYNNCIFNGQVFLYGASETFNKCTFNTTDSNNYNVWTYGAKEVAFNECTFNSAGKSVLIYHENATMFNDVAVTNSTFNASQAVDGKAAIEMDASLTAGINLTIDAATTATGFGTGNVSGNSLWNNKKGNNDVANNDITVKVGDTVVLAPIFEAQIGDAQYRFFQDAINAVQNGETITVLRDIATNVEIKEKDNVKVTIDGNGMKMTGTIKVVALSSDNDRRITIKNFKFEDTTSASVDFITSVETNHYPRITVEGCTFTGSGDATDVALRLKSSKNVEIKNCTGKGLHSFLQNTSGWNLTIEGVTVTESKSAFALGTVQGVTVKGCTVDVPGYGIRMDAGYNNNAVIESNTIKAFIPVVVRKATVNSNIAVNGTNNLTATNNDGIWMAIGTSEYEANGAMPTAATGNVVVALNDADLDSKGIYGNALAGQGTAEAPYLINNIGELVLFRNSVNAGETKYSAPGVHVVLAADIDMAGENWVGIGSATADHGFMGNFDGNGFNIKNLTIDNPALDSDGYAYAGLFGVTEGTDKDNQNTIKNLIIENVTINTTGQIVAAAIAYPYYTIVDNVKVCGDIKINGGNYTAGVLAYTRRCVNASNLAVAGNDGSYITGAQVVGGVISDIQMNGGLVAEYSNFSAEGVTVTGTKNVGGISGIIATQTLNGATVKNVTLSCSDASAGIVSGALGGTSTISNVTFENVTGATALLGATYNGNAIEAKIGDTYYATLEKAYAAAQEGETITMLAPVVIASGETLTLDKNVNVVYTSNVAGEDMFTNRGTLNISAGTITYANTDATGSNVTVSTISSEPGSVLNITGGTVENKTVKVDGSSIYSYAIDMLTNGSLGDVTATIEGGTVYSNYMAIRQFNNGTACKNSLTINGGYIYGAKRAVQVHLDNNAAYTTISGGKVEAGADGYAICNFAATGNLEVTGGEFIGAVYSARENFISGGTYNNPVEAAYCAAGYMPNKNTNGTYGVVLAQNVVASIDGVTYQTLAAAVTAAKAGETITLLQDVKENVTISKHLTIDGAGKTIIGMITTDGKSLKVTIKNVNFDGNSKTVNYAMRADDDLNLVVEDCSVKDYLYGFLYANKSNDKIVVKNVTVENCASYGAYLVSFNSATFENFTVSGAQYGVVVSNAGARKISFKNVAFNVTGTPLHINEQGTGNITFNFSGINDMGKADYYTSQYVKVVAAAQVGTKVCGSLQDAVVAANDGETVKVLADVNMTTANFVTQVDGYATLVNVAGKAVTIDLNGKKVTVNAADADLNGKAKGNMLMSVFHADPNGTLTLTDSSAEGTGTVELFANDATVYGLIVSENAKDKSHPGKIIVDGGNYIADKLSDSMIFADINEVITVNGGNFHLGNVGTGANGKPWIFNTTGQNQIHINVNGGTYNTNIGEQYYRDEFKLGNVLTIVYNEDGTWSVVTGVTLVDGEFTEYTNDKTQEVEYISYTRKSIPTTWTPIYVPFEIPVEMLADQGFEVAYINGVRRDDTDYDGELDKFVMESIYIHSQEEDKVDGSSKTLKANYPYFIRSFGDQRIDLNIVLEDAMLYAADDATYDCTTMTERFELIGNLSKVTIKASDDTALRYVVSGGEWSKRTKDSELNPFRFSMELTSRNGSDPTIDAPAMMSIAIRGEQREDGSTFIYDIEMDAQQTVDYIYDLQGRRVLEPQKGNLYIINGKKVIF